MKRTAKWNRLVVVVATLLILAVVNWAIWQKERHLAEGEVVYLELAPIDPRSLMQGDYMALNFALADRIRSALAERQPEGDAPQVGNGQVIVRLDAQRIAHFQRLGDNQNALRDDEKRLHYRLRNGHVHFATDAFFFQEGHAERYEPARYGQFRVNAQGKLLLVSLHDGELDALGDMIR